MFNKFVKYYVLTGINHISHVLITTKSNLSLSGAILNSLTGYASGYFKVPYGMGTLSICLVNSALTMAACPQLTALKGIAIIATNLSTNYYLYLAADKDRDLIDKDLKKIIKSLDILIEKLSGETIANGSSKQALMITFPR